METIDAVKLLAALAQESRLAVFRLLVQVGPEGMAAGKIGERLKELSHAGLISARQDGRFIFYSANYSTMNGLLAFLTENCCAGGSCEASTVSPAACCN
jgi:DNA-binding transcriptional ArsR family regulator